MTRTVLLISRRVIFAMYFGMSRQSVNLVFTMVNVHVVRKNKTDCVVHDYWIERKQTLEFKMEI